jgi:uncharacterized protein YjbI with pentapeptide repeats
VAPRKRAAFRVLGQPSLWLVKLGEGQEDTRARAAMPAQPTQRKIVDQFASARTRLLVTGSDRAGRPTVEVAHEALIRTWPRLRTWIDANREKLRARTGILQAKADWEQNGRRDDMLLPSGLQLERARSLLADPGDINTDDIQEFITLSSAREEAERKHRQDVLARERAAAEEMARLRAEREAQEQRDRAVAEEVARLRAEQEAREQRERASEQELARLRAENEAREQRERADSIRARIQRNRRWALGAVGAVFLITLYPSSQYLYTTIYLPSMFERALNTVKSDASPPEKRVEALRQLTEYQMTLPKDIDLSSIQLIGEKSHGLDLRGLNVRSLILTQATLENVNFQNARLPSSSFIRSNISRSNFENAFLSFARFDNSFIGSSKLSNTYLFRAVFNGARLCRVNFSEAIVRYTSFSDVTFDDDQPPNFENSAWWLATGWNKHQREVLTKQSVDKDPKATKSFKDDLKLVDEMPSQDPLLRARMLNEKAWTLHGRVHRGALSLHR